MKYLLILCLICSCQVIPKKEKKQSKKFISLKREGEIGKRVSVRILQKYPRYEQAQVQNYISNLGRSIVIRTGRQELYYYFSVLKSSDKKSFSAPGGFVFVTTGLIDSLESETQLVGILAKEIAFVNRKFHLKEVKKVKDLKKAADLIFEKLMKRDYSKKQLRAADYEAILGLSSMQYPVDKYVSVAGDSQYAKKLSTQMQVANPKEYNERFRELKNRI